MTYICSSHGCQLGVGVISRRHFNNVSGDNAKAVQASNDGSKLPSGPTPSFRRSRGGRKSWVNGIDLTNFNDEFSWIKVALTSMER